MNSPLTIIIPFLNEGVEVRNTVASIRETTVTQPSILLINDASTDGYDYSGVAMEFNCDYMEHKERRGVAASRDEGVSIIKTPWFLFLDAHMRFYESDWDARVIKLLEDNPRCLLCGQTQKLEPDEKGEIIQSSHKTCYGAYINMSQQQVFKAAWNYKDPMPESNLAEIPCILGAAYACGKEYWKYIGGLSGLRSYGFDEELISMKIWLEGGKCLLIKDWITGHIYRSKMPYTPMNRDLLYNQLYVLELFFPYEFKLEKMKILQNRHGLMFDEAFDLLKKEYQQVKKQKKLIRSIAENTIKDFLAKNSCFEVCAT